MHRRLILALAIAGLGASPAVAQNALYGGPYRGGPYPGGPTGPTLLAGPFVPAYPGPMPFPYQPYYSSQLYVSAPSPVNYYYPSAWSFIPQQVSQAPRPTGPQPGTIAQPNGPARTGDRTAVTEQRVPPSALGLAHFTVRVPASATLLVNDADTRQAGPARRFHTPDTLEPGKAYEYTFRAQWTENGQVITRDRTVRFKSGDDLPVDLTEATAR
jgi:uncharacterized protein (TIGR03000 family)